MDFAHGVLALTRTSTLRLGGLRNRGSVYRGCAQTESETQFAIFERTDFCISVSRTKFDEEAVDVRPAVARQKPYQISENKFFDPKLLPKNFV